MFHTNQAAVNILVLVALFLQDRLPGVELLSQKAVDGLIKCLEILSKALQK